VGAGMNYIEIAAQILDVDPNKLDKELVLKLNSVSSMIKLVKEGGELNSTQVIATIVMQHEEDKELWESMKQAVNANLKK
jgi:predicted oxidoreductase (fatty acid repression mutant protein)